MAICHAGIAFTCPFVAVILSQRYVPFFAIPRATEILLEFSSFQPSVHQSPDERHGPADHKIFPCSFLRSVAVSTARLAGRPCDTRTRSRHAGRRIRNARKGRSLASDIVRDLTGFSSSAGVIKRSTRKLSGRWLSSRRTIPARRSPTIPLIRASVISSFSASGVTGRNSPRCAVRGGAGSAVIHTFVTGAPGGWAAKSNCSNFKKILVSRMETGNRRTRA